MYPSRVVDLRPRAGVRETREQPDPEQLDLIGWRSLLGKGAWAIADKGLVNGSNFVISVALARWLSPQDYGAFALAFAIFLLLASGHTALFTDPMLVFGAGTYRERSPAYLGVLLRGHWAFTAAASLILFTAAIGVILAGHRVLANALAALAFASPLILLHWLLRQACYIRLDARQAACAGASYMMCVVLGTYFLHHRSWLSPATAISLMGLASLVSALGMFISLGMRRPYSREPQLFHDVVADHWCYGRWSLGTYALSWIKEGIYYLLLPGWGGLGAAAALKALLNVTQPITHTYGALSCVLVPALVGARKGPAVSRIARTALGLLSVGALLYWVFLGLFHRSVVHWLYNGQYEEYAGLLWVVSAIPILYAGEIVLGSVLRSRERPHHVFWANMLSAITALTVGAACVFAFGLHGAVVGLFCSSIATTATMALVLRRHRLADD